VLLKPSVGPLSWFPRAPSPALRRSRQVLPWKQQKRTPADFSEGTERIRGWLTVTGGLENRVGSPAETDASDRAVRLIGRVCCCCQALGAVARTTWCRPAAWSRGHCSGSLALHSTCQASVSERRPRAGVCLRCLPDTILGRGFRCWATERSDRSVHCSVWTLGTY